MILCKQIKFLMNAPESIWEILENNDEITINSENKTCKKSLTYSN